MANNNSKSPNVPTPSQAEVTASVGAGHPASPQVVNGVQVRATTSIVGWLPQANR